VLWNCRPSYLFTIAVIGYDGSWIEGRTNLDRECATSQIEWLYNTAVTDKFNSGNAI